MVKTMNIYFFVGNWEQDFRKDGEILPTVTSSKPVIATLIFHTTNGNSSRSIIKKVY
jgi:hypothetical protein